MRGDSPAPGTAGFPRRDFLVLVGQAGWGIVVAGPWLGDALRPLPPAFRPGLQEPEGLYSGLHWRLLGPFRGGRADAVAGVPGRPNEFYFGAVGGGVWKSVDGGRVWAPISDALPVASIGALAVAPSRPDVLYVGTGEGTLRDSAASGDGVYRSTDGGLTWTHLGLERTRHIGKIAVDPRTSRGSAWGSRSCSTSRACSRG